MHNRFSMALLFLLLIVATSCAQKTSKTAFKLTTAGFAAVGSDLEAVSGGGLMVWGISLKGESFGKVLLSSNSFEIDLPNGDWRFYSMAWNGASPLDGSTALRCAQTISYSLDGSPLVVDLSLTQSSCDLPVFKGHVAAPASAGFKILTCTDSTNITAATGVTYDALKTCSNDPTASGRVSNKAPVMSVRVHLLEHVSIKGVVIGGGLSKCIDLSGTFTGMSPATGIKLPVGSVGDASRSPFRMRLDYYVNSTDCGVSGEVPTAVDLPNGLVSDVPGKKYFVEGTNTHLLVMNLPDATLCEGRRLKTTHLAHPFAGGNGSLTNPHLICSAEQLYGMHDVALANSFRLMTDINLNTYTKALVEGTALESALPVGQKDCWDDSANWQPLGGEYSDTTDCATTYTTTAFTGSFDGGGYTLTGLRMRMEDEDNVGFIGLWDSSPTTGKFLNDVNFSSVEITGSSQIGTLAGKVTGNTEFGLVKGIKLSKANLEARFNGANNIGGVVGSSDWASYKKIKLEDVWIKANGNGAGGVVGVIQDTQYFREVFARSTHVIQNDSNPVNSIGGLVGFIQAGSAVMNGIELLSHDGIIVSSGSQIGGLFGFLGSGSMGIQNFYANSAIYAGGEVAGSVGGIVGRNAYSGLISRGYFSGSIIDECLSGCNRSALSGENLGSYTFSDFTYINSAISPTVSAGSTDAVGLGSTNSIGAQVRDPVSMNAFAANANWIHHAGSLPYLIAEQHPCGLLENIAPIATQIASRGTESNPIRICNRFQLDSILADAGSRHMVLESGVNISDSAGISVPSGATLSGGKGFLFGFFKPNFTGSGNLAPIISNAGTIQNMTMAHTLIQEIGASPGTQISPFVAVNDGVIRDVKIMSSKLTNTTSNAKLAGAVNVNNPSGLIEKLSSFTSFRTTVGEVSGLVTSNSGKIYDSIAQNGILSNTAISSISGIANINNATGVIAGVTVASSLNTQGTTLSQSSFGVLTNHGTLQDIHIDSRTRWEAVLAMSSIGNATLVRDNSATGIVRGAIINGWMVESPAATVTTDATTNAKPVRVNSGVSDNILALVPSGRSLYSTSIPTEFTCSEVFPASIRKDTTYGTIADSYLITDADLIGAGKFTWLVLETKGHYESYLLGSITTSSPTNFLRISDSAGDFNHESDFTCAKFNSADQITIIQDLNTTSSKVLGNPLTATHYSGFFPSQFMLEKTSFPAASYWRQSGVLLEEDSASADWPAILAYYETLLSGGTPVAPGKWGIREEDPGKYRVRLFKNDD